MRAGWIGSDGAGQQGPVAVPGGAVGSPQALRPFRGGSRAGGRQPFGQPAQHEGQVPAHRHLHGVGPAVVGGVGQVDHLGRGRGVAEDAVAEAEVQRRADDDHHVRALEGRGPRPRDQARVARGAAAPDPAR